MKILFLMLLVVSVFASMSEGKPDDENTEAEGPGRCAYCDEHTVRVDERDIETNPSALVLLHQAQPAEGEPAKKSKPSGVR